MKRIITNLGIVIFLMSLLSMCSYAFDFGKSFNSFKSKATNSYSRVKQKSRNTYYKTRHRVKNSYNRVKNSYSKVKQKSRSTYYKTRHRVKNSYNRVKNKSSNIYTKTQQGYKNIYNKTRGGFTKHINRIKEKKAVGYISRIKNKIFKGASARDKITQFKTQYGMKGINLLKKVGSQYSYNVRDTVTRSLFGLKNNAVKIFNKSKSKIDHINSTIKDPKTKKRLIQATIVAAAVSYYAYQHQDDIKYKIVKSALSSPIIVDGKQTTMEDIITQQITQQYPQLKGTRLAEDPSSVVAYGVIAIGKEDMIHNIKIIKDSSGNRKSIADTFPAIDKYEDAANALDMSSSVEKIALQNASSGQLGAYAQDFAIAHNEMEQNFGKN